MSTDHRRELVIPIALPAAQLGPGDPGNSAAEDRLTAALIVNATQAVEAVIGHLATQKFGADQKAPGPDKSNLREEAERLIFAKISALAPNYVRDHGRRVGWSGLDGGQANNSYQRTKGRWFERFYGHLDPEAAIEQELLIIAALNSALQRAREYAEALRALSRIQAQRATPSPELMALISASPGLTSVQLLWVALYGRLNPAEIWPSWSAARDDFEAAVFVGLIAAGHAILLEPETAEIVASAIDARKKKARPKAGKDFFYLHLQDVAEAAIGLDELRKRSWLAIQTRKPVRVAPRFSQAD